MLDHSLSLELHRLPADLGLSAPAQIIREAFRDARHAVRLWAKHPGLTAFAIAALAIGIGANTGVFSVVDALVVRSLPFQDPSRLAGIHTYLIPHDSAKQFDAWRGESSYLVDAALFEQGDVNLGNDQSVLRAHNAQFSYNFFSVLGATPMLGRGFSAENETPGRTAVAMIGYGLRQELFAGKPRVLGSTIRVNGTALTVIGVMPPRFDYPGHAQFWQPGEFRPGNNGWEAVGRLRPGVNWASGTRHSRMVREGLVAAQVMVTVVLLTASVSVGRGFARLMQTYRGFDMKGLVTAGVSIQGTTRQGNDRPLAYFEEVLARVRRLPGVQSAGRFLTSLVTDTQTIDLWGFSLTTAVVCMVAAVSIWSATRPIARLDILEILTAE